MKKNISSLIAVLACGLFILSSAKTVRLEKEIDRLRSDLNNDVSNINYNISEIYNDVQEMLDEKAKTGKQKFTVMSFVKAKQHPNRLFSVFTVYFYKLIFHCGKFFNRTYFLLRSYISLHINRSPSFGMRNKHFAKTGKPVKTSFPVNDTIFY